ncbi:VanZ family protein [Streptacidiphilus sp. EB103A]|uniref:VanZ family protein n=1 Tax=Streptacidiphilus sp. EB103A TaxID=3156275 RepID=UPI00351988B3
MRRTVAAAGRVTAEGGDAGRGGAGQHRAAFALPGREMFRRRRGAGVTVTRKPTSAPAAARVPRPRARRVRSLGARLLRAVVGTVAMFGLALCAAVIVKLTLTPSPASVGIAHTNLHPGTSIRLYLDRPSVREALLQIGGNILIGVPFGLLLPVITPRARGLLRTVLICSFVVLLLELAQHFFVKGRSFDVDDIILAALGAAIGYLPLGRRLSLRIHPSHRHGWQRRWDAARRRPRGTVR